MAKLLIVDDETLILDAFELTFPDHDLLMCENASDAMEVFTREQPDVVLCDIRLPGTTGLELFRKIHDVDKRTPVVLMTGHGTARTAIEAMRLGAFDYLLKPLDPDTLIPLVDSAIETSRLMRVPARMPDSEVGGEADLLVGNCTAMQQVYRDIGRVASQDLTVLIRGESGTGKEVVARAIYHYSRRANKPFLAVNCAAIPEQLLESELFGHEKGSFTGADRTRIGKFEQCSGGTLFLDEIGDMPLTMQTKILRVLQDQTFERVGGSQPIQTDVRLIAATNRDLEALIERGEFRRDLFYRLNVYTISLPALRDRRKDIGLLAEYFCRQFCKELRKEVEGITPEAQQLLASNSWPGNVRELQSVIKHALLVAQGPLLIPAFFPEHVRRPSSNTSAKPADPDNGVTRRFDSSLPDLASAQANQETISQLIDRHRELHPGSLYDSVCDDVERRMITRMLEETDGNQSEAARLLGITRTTIRAKINKLEIGIHRVVQ